MRLSLAGPVALLALLTVFPSPASAHEAALALYGARDDGSGVDWTPHVRVLAEVAPGTQVEAAYTVDLRSREWVDITSSATITSSDLRRDELSLAVGHDFSALRLRARYRYATQPECRMHVAVLELEQDLAEGNATLLASVFAHVGDALRPSEPAFSKSRHGLGGRVGLRQVLDRQTIAQAVYELGYAGGYLAEYGGVIAINSTTGSCVGATACVAENAPDHRLRNAVALGVRRALGPSFSAGADYRFYIDEWSLRSHTVEPEFSWLADDDTVLRLRYRGYFQHAAAHYHAIRSVADLSDPRSGDPRLSAFNAHRLGLDFEHGWSFDEGHEQLDLALGLGVSRYDYRDLGAVDAIDATLAASFSL